MDLTVDTRPLTQTTAVNSTATSVPSSANAAVSQAADRSLGVQQTRTSLAGIGDSGSGHPMSDAQAKELLKQCAPLQHQVDTFKDPSIRESPAEAGERAGVAGPIGSTNLRDTMLADMKKTNPKATVSQPPTEAELRTYYSTTSDFKASIQAHKYGDAAASCQKQLDALPDTPENQGKRDLLKSQMAQFKETDHMQQAAQSQSPPGNVSFPPTLDEAKAHFRGLKDSPNSQVGQEFQNYTDAFYSHVQSDKDGNKNADIGYGPNNDVAPSKTTDVTDDRQLNRNGQRLIDCEGYTYLGKELLSAAGYKQPPGGGYHVVREVPGPNASDARHIMLNMKRGDDDIWVSNDTAYSDSASRNVYQAHADYKAANRGAAVEDYYGTSEQQASDRSLARDASHRGSLGNPSPT